jgi:pectate disaccharide-lyase
MTKISGSSANVWSWNPSNNNSTLVGTFATTGSRTFSLSAGTVLVLDDASKGFNAPGITGSGTGSSSSSDSSSGSSSGGSSESVTYTLNASVVNGHGTIVVSPSVGPYAQGTIVSLTATPDSGYQMKTWIGTDNDSSKSNSNTVKMNADRTVTVEFEAILNTEVSKGSGDGGGGCYISTIASDSQIELTTFLVLFIGSMLIRIGSFSRRL